MRVTRLVTKQLPATRKPLFCFFCFPLQLNRYQHHRHPFCEGIDDKTTPTVVGCKNDRQQTGRPSSRPRPPCFALLSEDAKRETVSTAQEICSWPRPFLSSLLILVFQSGWSLAGFLSYFNPLRLTQSQEPESETDEETSQDELDANGSSVRLNIRVYPWNTLSELCATFLAVP